MNKTSIEEWENSIEKKERFGFGENWINYLNKLSNEQIEALTAYQNLFGTIDVSDFEDKYFGHFEGFFGDINTAFGEHMLQEMGELEQVPQHLRYYIDSEAYGRDLLINDFCEFEGFVFRNC